MKPRKPGATWAVLLSVLAPLLGFSSGCSRDSDACTSSNVDGCLAACDQKKAEACRTLGEALARDGALKAGAMFIERACAAGDAASCQKLSSLPVSMASASASAPAVRVAPLSCPFPAASASASAPAPAPAPVASASAPAASSAPAPAAPAPAAPPAPAVIPAVPAGSSPEIADLQGRCTKGEGTACTTLGDRFAEGVGVASSSSQATEAHAAGCERSDARGCRLASRELLARSPGAIERAVVLLRRGCTGSDPGSCAMLGEVALGGSVAALTPAYGATQVRSACTNNFAPACRRLSQLLREGGLVTKDDDAAARAEGRSLELLDQGCQKGTLEDCLLLGLWRERPGLIGESGDAPRTTDKTSLDGAVDAYKKACDGGLPAGCTRAAAVLDAQQKTAEAAASRGKLEATCVAGDGASCAELLDHAAPPQPAARKAALVKACELMIPRACTALGEELLRGGAADADASLARACAMGDAAGCDAHLRWLQASQPGKLAEAQRDVCLRLGGAPCVPVARGVRAGGDEACASRLLARACRESPEPSAEGCASVAEISSGEEAAHLDDLACAEGLKASAPLSSAVAASCGRKAQRSRGADAVAAERSCEAGDRLGCKTLAQALKGQGGDEARKRAEAAALKACKLGDRQGCDLRFGPLPSPPTAASATLSGIPAEPPPLSCHLSPRPGASGALLLLPALLSLLARRRSR